MDVMMKVRSMRYPTADGGFKTFDDLMPEQKQKAIDMISAQSEQPQPQEPTQPQDLSIPYRPTESEPVAPESQDTIQQPAQVQTDKVLAKIQQMRYPTAEGGFKTWNDLTPEQKNKAYEMEARRSGEWKSGFAASAESSLDRLVGGSQYALGELLDSEGLKHTGIRNLQEADKYVPEVSSYKDIDTFSEAGDYLAGLAGGALPYLAAAPVAAATGGIPFIGGAIGAGTMLGATALSETGANAYEQRKLTGGVDWTKAMGVGVGTAAIERILPGFRYGKGLVKGAGKTFAGMATSTASTLGETALQTGLSNVSLGQDFMANMDEALVGSAVAGSAIGAGRGLLSKVGVAGADKVDAAKFRDLEARNKQEANLQSRINATKESLNSEEGRLNQAYRSQLQKNLVNLEKQQMHMAKDTTIKGSRFQDLERRNQFASESLNSAQRNLMDLEINKDAAIQRYIDAGTKKGLDAQKAEARFNRKLNKMKEEANAKRGRLRTIEQLDEAKAIRDFAATKDDYIRDLMTDKIEVDAAEAEKMYAKELKQQRIAIGKSRKEMFDIHSIENDFENNLGALKLLQESGAKLDVSSLAGKKVNVLNEETGQYDLVDLTQAMGIGKGRLWADKATGVAAGSLPFIGSVGGMTMLDKRNTLTNIVGKFNTNFQNIVNSFADNPNITPEQSKKLQSKINGIKGDLTKFIDGKTNVLSSKAIDVLALLDATHLNDLDPSIPKGIRGGTTKGKTSMLDQVQEMRAAKEILGEVDGGDDLMKNFMLSSFTGYTTQGLVTAYQAVGGILGNIGKLTSRKKVDALLKEYDAQSSVLVKERRSKMSREESTKFRKELDKIRLKVLRSKTGREASKWFKEYNDLIMPPITPVEEETEEGRLNKLQGALSL